MRSELKSSISVMGVSDPEMVLSEKDLNAMEFNFLVRTPLGIHHEHRKKEEEESQVRNNQEEKKIQDEGGDGFDVLVSTLKLKIPSAEEFRVDDDDDVFKTPTSSDKIIPATLRCPPAPRKPKSLPSTKRKACQHRQVFVDVSDEIESLFPPVLLADLGGKIKKKVRKGN